MKTFSASLVESAGYPVLPSRGPSVPSPPNSSRNPLPSPLGLLAPPPPTQVSSLTSRAHPLQGFLGPSPPPALGAPSPHTPFSSNSHLHPPGLRSLQPQASPRCLRSKGWKPGQPMPRPRASLQFGFPQWLRGEESACNAGDMGSITG